LELTVLEDSSTRLDFTVSWWDGGHAPGYYIPPTSDLVFGTSIGLEEHLPLLFVGVMSDYRTPLLEAHIFLCVTGIIPMQTAVFLEMIALGTARSIP
jgi:hypothetical protein